MFQQKTVLAVVPARSGSKGIPHKNLRPLAGQSLIARAAECLGALPWLDARVISTDSPKYAREAEKHGLAAPFLRPPALSTDGASAVDTMLHALQECEAIYAKRFDIVLIIEPTSPFRRPDDIEAAVALLNESGADSVVSVSPLDTKGHPAKVLRIERERVYYYEDRGAGVVARQALEPLFWRNGLCYALTRRCLVEQKAIFTRNTAPLVVPRPVVNIDDPIDFAWAEFLLTAEPAGVDATGAQPAP